jgi:succinyl-diaminopimelate desuccinylase
LGDIDPEHRAIMPVGPGSRRVLAGFSPGHRLAVVTTLGLDLAADPVALTAALVDIRSVSGEEGVLADAVERALRATGRFELIRDGDAVVARTALGRDRRMVLAGHLDTVPVADNLPSRAESHPDGDRLYGCGTTDMKAGLAVLLHLAATVADPAYDLTVVAYDHEEVDSALNGLGRLARNRPDLLDGDLAVLMEPTGGAVEAGCQGTLRAEVTIRGRRAHSARSWLGDNAVHAAGALLDRLAGYRARSVEIDGCTYREGLNAVRITGGVAGNIIPDHCAVELNFRFAPDRSEVQAAEHVGEVLGGYDWRLTDSAPGALPGLGRPAAAAFVAAVSTPGNPARAKLGWTDVARFAALGIPAVNFGPGDPNVAHTRDEYVEVGQISAVAAAMRRYLAVS